MKKIHMSPTSRLKSTEYSYEPQYLTCQSTKKNPYLPMSHPTDTPPSFLYFNQSTDETFHEYVETYCSMIEKKEKQQIQNSIKANFFIEEQQQNNPSYLNMFTQNLSFPSINFFEYKQYHNTGVASVKNIEIKDDLSIEQQLQADQKSNFENSLEKRNLIPQKSEQNKVKNSTLLPSANVQNYQSNNVQARQKRLLEIIATTSEITQELQRTLRYFITTVARQ